MINLNWNKRHATIYEYAAIRIAVTKDFVTCMQIYVRKVLVVRDIDAGTRKMQHVTFYCSSDKNLSH